MGRQVHAFFRQRTAQMLATAAPHSSPLLPHEELGVEVAAELREC